jgi:exopolysaccharide production protein ExoZ
LYHAHSIGLNHARQLNVLMFQTPTFWNSCIELFFVMSGFLMLHMSKTLYGREGGVKEFIMRRLIRTPPLYYFYTTLVFAVFLAVPSVADHPATLYRYITSLLFIPTGTPPVIAIGWTLNYEIYFYGLVALSILLPYPLAPLACIAFLIASVTIGYTLINGYFLYVDPLLINFAIGSAIALLYHERVVLGWAGRLLALLTAFLLLGTLDSIADNVERLIHFGPAIGLIVAAATLTEHPVHLGRWSALLTWVGERAYTLYLSHILTLKLTEKIVYRLFPATNPFLFILIGSIVALVATSFLYILIEKPMSRWLRDWLKRRTQRKALGRAGRVSPEASSG